jgi:protein-tyrosine-phosphatase
MTKKILFLCPHNAAKSVMAAAYFQRLAEERNLDYTAESAGTEPSETVSGAVAELLLVEGIDVRAHQPRSVTREELGTARRVISMGCDIEDIKPPGVEIDHWDVPMASEDLQGARAAIRQAVEALVNELKD